MKETSANFSSPIVAQQTGYLIFIEIKRNPIDYGLIFEANFEFLFVFLVWNKENKIL